MPQFQMWGIEWVADALSSLVLRMGISDEESVPDLKQSSYGHVGMILHMCMGFQLYLGGVIST